MMIPAPFRIGGGLVWNWGEMERNRQIQPNATGRVSNSKVLRQNFANEGIGGSCYSIPCYACQLRYPTSS